MAEKRDRLSRLEARWSLLEAIGRAFPWVGAAMSGLIAYLTDFMAAWSPLSWFASAVVGWLAFSAIQLVMSAKKERDERARRIALLEAPKGHINPTATRFVGERIYISDILPPLGFIVSGKEFRDCEIIGPANILFTASAPGRGELADCTLYESDGVIVDDDAQIMNTVVFQDCSFRGCSLYKTTILMPPGAFRKFSGELRGLSWLNRSSVE